MRVAYPLVALALVGCASSDLPVADTAVDAWGSADIGVRESLAGGEPVQVIVRLADDLVEAELARLRDPADRAETEDLRALRSERYRDLQEPVVFALPASALHHRYDHLPFIALDLTDESQLDALLAMPEVLRVHEDLPIRPALTQSLALIGQDVTLAAGSIGAGTSVAVLDTGANWTQADLGSCTAVNTPSSCRVAFARDFATEDSVMDDLGHGTNVASIVSRVAPGADILALDVFEATHTADTADILAAVDWSVANKAAYNIVAANLSLGGGLYTNPCDSDPLAVGMASLATAGIVPVVATGNNASVGALPTPACGTASFSVGAVYDANLSALSTSVCSDSTPLADEVACFSNTHASVDLVAPGAMINAGGYNMSGTSQAAPHVAGAVAVVAALFPDDSVAERESRLVDNGVTVTDARNGLSYPRLDLAAAAADCVTAVSPLTGTATAGGGSGSVSLSATAGCAWTAVSNSGWLSITGSAVGSGSGSTGWTAAPNTGAARTGTLTVGRRTVSISQAADAAPTGSVTINAGSAATKASAVNLSLSASDTTGGVTQMCLSNTASCTSWESYATTKSWSLASGTGAKTVSVWFRDAYGNTSAAATDTIVVDTTAPTNGSVVATPGDAQVGLSWSGFSDALSGITSYKVVYGATTPTSCSAGTLGYSGSGTSASVNGLTNGTTYGFRVCAVDAAGNLSTGAVVTAKAALETAAPDSASIALNSGATWARSSAVTVTLAATDDNGVAKACLSNSATSCTTWFTYATSKSWSLSAGEGNKTVYAWFQDTQGNKTPTPVADSIEVDKTAPTDGTVGGAGGDGNVTLTWTGFADARSGLASFKVVRGTTAPTSCSAGTVVYEGASTGTQLFGLTNGASYGFRVCAIDNAGNISTGATYTLRPAPEYNAPTGASVSINSGAAWSKSGSVTLTLGATDASGVAKVCISNSSTCTTWSTAVTTKTWSLASGAGTRSVNVWFQDNYGNSTLLPATDSIGVDNAVPTNGAMSLAPSSGRVGVSWSGFTDAQSGVASYKVVYGVGSAPSSCAAGTVGWSGTGSSTTITGLTDGTAYGFRVCAVDAAGNVSTGVSSTARPAPEYDPPVATGMGINGGAAWTRTSGVTLSFNVTDANEVKWVCLTNGATCNTWQPYTASIAWGLASGSGQRTVKAWFKDRYNNTTAAAVSDTIGLDTVAPTTGSLTATPAGTDVALSWTGFADVASGIASYKVVYATGTSTPASGCTSGTTLWAGTGTSATHTAPTRGLKHTYRVCAVDVAGNTSTGATKSVTP